MTTTATKPIPAPTPDTQPYWDGCLAGELRIQRCRPNAHYYFYPRPICPECATTDVEWVAVSGRATLYSYVISARPTPGFENDTPYAIAVVELAEGPRLMTNIVGIENTPENLQLDMPLTVEFQSRGDVTVPVFRPEEQSA